MTTQNLQERKGAITFRGTPMTLLGQEITVGQAAPEFHLTAADLSIATLDTILDGGKRAALLIVVPSLDTAVCSLESQTFNKRLGELPQGVAAFVVSMDLPFAQARWAANEGDVALHMLSDYRDHSFGLNYGLLIGEIGLLARAVIVIGKDRKVHYVQLVTEVSHEPDYEATLAAAKAAS
jgi:thiol peroxidase